MAESTADRLRATIARTGGAWVTCVGTSMEPTIPRGARIRVAETRPAAIRAGDVVIFATAAGFVTHRVVARLGRWLLHAGDGATAAPGLVRADRVLGRVLLPRRAPPLGDRVRAAVRVARRMI